ncbi:uncharacterized protein PG986_007579 [Apiospora aurea]|uniref:Translation machinery-associated protein 22 n=1 Tax=Apiospora aurea TaxID=335848 RepID=A0ABR1QCZ3_9PEZI
MADTETVDAPSEPQGRHVTYCGGKQDAFTSQHCMVFPLYSSPRGMLQQGETPSHTMAFEESNLGLTDRIEQYCEYGGTAKKCQDWLQKAHPSMYEQIWSPEALEAATANLSVAAQERAAKDAKKKAAQAEKAEQKQADKMANSVVTIKRVERNKRKFVTAVSGLEAFGLELKKVAKEFGKKFATGASVTKLPSGGEEIVVQGDVSDEIEEFLLEKYKDIPEDNIELVDDKKKKSSAAA